MNKRTIIILHAIMTVGVLAGTFGARSPFKETAKDISEALPPQVKHLFEWPEATVLSGPKRVLEEDQKSSVRRAKKTSIEWIEKVFSSKWIPSDANNLKDDLIMIRNGFNSLDTTYVQWSKNEYLIKVSQTPTVIAIKLTPLQNQSMGKTAEEKRLFAKQLCKQFINDTGTRDALDSNNKPIKATVPNLSEKIAQYLFRPALQKDFSDGTLAGRSPGPMEEGLNLAVSMSTSEVNTENRADNPNWNNSRFSWGYWWRHINWWHDGGSVGVFILKKDNDAINFDYWSIFGEWF